MSDPMLCHLVHYGIELTDCELPELPAGSVIDVLTFPPECLAYGDLVYGRQSDQPVVGRFLGRRGDNVELARRGRRHVMSGRDTVGRVIRARVQGREIDPRRSRIANLVTWFCSRVRG